MIDKDGHIGATEPRISDVKSALGVSDVHTLRGLCRHARINKWSAHKPISVGADRLALDDMSKYNYGLSVVSAADAASIIAKMKNESTRTWPYTKPSGGKSSPYRLGDFRLYNPNAGTPFRSFSTDGTNENFIPAGQQFGLQIYLGHQTGDSTQIHFADMGVGGSSVSGYYPAVIVADNNWNYKSIAFCQSTCAQLNGQPANISLSLTEGSYYLIPVLSNVSNGTPSMYLTTEFEPMAARAITPFWTSTAELSAGLNLYHDTATCWVVFNTGAGLNDGGNLPITFYDFVVSFGTKDMTQQYTYGYQVKGTSADTVEHNQTLEWISISLGTGLVSGQLISDMQHGYTIYAQAWYKIKDKNGRITQGNTEQIVVWTSADI